MGLPYEVLKFAQYINRPVISDCIHMKTCGIELIILDFDTSDHGLSPSLAVVCDFCCCILFFLFVVIIFGV